MGTGRFADAKGVADCNQCRPTSLSMYVPLCGGPSRNEGASYTFLFYFVVRVDEFWCILNIGGTHNKNSTI
jgi:hypothetical protein